jgi:hypothetical protein
LIYLSVQKQKLSIHLKCSYLYDMDNSYHLKYTTKATGKLPA